MPLPIYPRRSRGRVWIALNIITLALFGCGSPPKRSFELLPLYGELQVLQPNDKILRAIKDGDGVALQRLIEAGVSLGKDNSYRTPPLNIAISLGRVDFVRELLTAGADGRVEDITGQNALTLAASLGLPEAVQLLIDTGLEADLASYQNITPLMYAAGGNSSEAAMFFLSGRHSRGYRAANRPYLRCMEILLEHGASPNYEHELVGSPLSWAWHSGNKAAVRLLEAAAKRKRSQPDSNPEALRGN